jgi:hypothetical protein
MENYQIKYTTRRLNDAMYTAQAVHARADEKLGDFGQKGLTGLAWACRGRSSHFDHAALCILHGVSH